MLKAQAAIDMVEAGLVVKLTDSYGRRMELVKRDGRWLGVSDLKNGKWVQQIEPSDMLHQPSDWNKLAEQLGRIDWLTIPPHKLKKIALLLKEK